MKRRALFFTETNAVVIKEDDIDSNIKNLVINPDLSFVRGVPPQHWKFQDGKIVPMNKEEKGHRENLINEIGIISKPELIEALDAESVETQKLETLTVYKTNLWIMALILLVGGGLGVAIMHYLGGVK